MSTGTKHRKSRAGGRRLAALTAYAALGAPRLALADVPEAERLFREGRQLMQARHVSEACEKFGESQRLEASSGTLLNLATCHAELGKTATASAEFREAARLARAQGREERAVEAERRAMELEPRLSRLQVKVAQPVPGLVITRNGEPISAADLDAPVALDPNAYVIVASAPGRAEWRTVASVSASGAVEVVEVPPLVPLAPEKPLTVSEPVVAPRPVPIASPPRAEPSRSARGGLPVGFWVSAGTSVAAAGVGATFGVLSLNSYASAESACPSHQNCNAEAMRAGERADTQSTVSTVLFGAAAAAVAATIWFYVTADDSPERASRATASRGR